MRTRLRSLGPATLSFGYELVRKADGRGIVDGYTGHAAVDRAGRVRRIPAEIRALFGPPADGAGEPDSAGAAPAAGEGVPPAN